jgi:hypothetical protein
MADPWQTLPPMRYAGRDGPALRVPRRAPRRGPARASCSPSSRRTWCGSRCSPAGAARVGAPGRSSAARATSAPRGATARTSPSSPAPSRGRRRRRRAAAAHRPRSPRGDARAVRAALVAPDGAPLFEDHPELGYRFARGGGRGVRHTLRRDLDEVVPGPGRGERDARPAPPPLPAAPRRRARVRRRARRPALQAPAGRPHARPRRHATGLLYDTGAEATFDLGSEIDHYLGPYRYAELQATELDAYVLIGPALPTWCAACRT